jgi:hypothetical protein
MLGLNPRNALFPAILLVAASGALTACSDGETTTSTTTTSSSSAASTGGAGGEGGSGQGGSGQGGNGQGGGGGAACVPSNVPAETIKGTITFMGTAMKGDALRIVAFKDGNPGGGAPAGYVFTDPMTPPTFPYAYEFKVTLPPTGTGEYGVQAYLDVGGNNIMGPDLKTDPAAMPSMLVTVDNCKGATVDLTLMAPPP